MQPLNKEYHTTILATGAALEALHGEFPAQPLAEVTLRGESRSLPIYQVLSSAGKPAGA